jgi:hypothetical protein
MDTDCLSVLANKESMYFGREYPGLWGQSRFCSIIRATYPSFKAAMMRQSVDSQLGDESA